ncbi:hypothetical protein GJ744_010566 [Endocarpon pusillum]|uniref:PNPLA domain-containing protein n=1 Tax=Endocarpon pusillum TaxID=364733 RepID=A0A8H7AXZ0_9EURO|nr:hypothetical protein GJ744_010566 [Endocarpon pusillum]
MGRVQDRFDTKELEKAIKEIVFQQCGREGGSEDALLQDGDGRKVRCKVFVCATRKETADKMQFRSYRSARGSSELLEKTRIWEAARATSAAPSFFDSIKIGTFGEEFVDGGTGANNPVRTVWIEAKHTLLRPEESLERNLKCLVSIGTGVPSLKPFGDNMLEIGKTLMSMAVETEATAESFHREHSELDEGNQFFRFSVTEGLQGIGLQEAAQKGVIMAATRRYVESQTVKRQMSLCGKNVGENKPSSIRATSNHVFGLHLGDAPEIEEEHFFGRAKELGIMKDYLLSDHARSRQKIFILFGPGGMGKT